MYLEGSIEDIILGLAFFASVVTIVYFSIQSGLKQKKFLHDQRMLAIEKGVSIPMEPPQNNGKKKVKNPYIWPFVFLGAGLAWSLGSMFAGDFEFIWALILLFIGGGWLAAIVMFKNKSEKEQVDIEEETVDEIVIPPQEAISHETVEKSGDIETAKPEQNAEKNSAEKE